MPQGKPAANSDAAKPGGFDRIQSWIFDLDNTLYPAECSLFAQVDQRMASFIARELGMPLPQARHIQKTYYKQFGTTLSGLMQVYKVDPHAFLEYVHDIDLSALKPSLELRQALQKLPGRRLIFTNGSRRHAEQVAEKLGVLDLFEDIADIASGDFIPKPSPDAYRSVICRHGIDSSQAAMFEDMPHNLEAPHALGMRTVLIQSDYLDHPVQLEMRRWTKLPDHIHHMTDDLIAFLDDLVRN